MKYKYRVYEAINNDGETFKEHGEFKILEEAQFYASNHHRKNNKSTFIINYKLEDGGIAEQYYGDWTN